MKDISDAADLIATARDALLNDLLPRLQKEQRYTGLMIANAMAIALREQTIGRRRRPRRGRANSHAARQRAAPVSRHRAAAAHDELRVLRRRSVQSAIRAGQFDDASRSPALVANLARTAADWVAISNPKALRTDRRGRLDLLRDFLTLDRFEFAMRVDP